MELQKRVVWAYSRMNPPSIGHYDFLKECVKAAKEKKAQCVLFLSKSEDTKKNPLSLAEKEKIIKELKVAGLEINDNPEASNIIAVYRILAFAGVTDQWCMCGPDRKADYEKFADRNKTRFDTSEVLCPKGRVLVDGDDVSGTRVREAALKGDFELFKKLVAPVSDRSKKDIFDKIRSRIVIKERKVSKTTKKGSK